MVHRRTRAGLANTWLCRRSSLAGEQPCNLWYFPFSRFFENDWEMLKMMELVETKLMLEQAAAGDDESK